MYVNSFEWDTNPTRDLCGEQYPETAKKYRVTVCSKSIMFSYCLSTIYSTTLCIEYMYSLTMINKEQE